MTTAPSRPRFTEQQAAAIETRGVSIALSAGAGCGKTFVLTQRFLKGLEPGDDSAELHSLVAITFTDKAAREMRDRIRSACNQRLQQCESDEVEHWLTILRGLDSARVSTIHSFCTSLLRSQAVEAGLDPRFAVLEPALADTLLRNTAQETLHKLLEHDDADAAAFVLQFGLERSRELLRTLAKQRFQIDFAKFDSVFQDDERRGDSSPVPSPPSSGERVRVRRPGGDDAPQPQQSSSLSLKKVEQVAGSDDVRPPHPNPLPLKAGGEGTGKGNSPISAAEALAAAWRSLWEREFVPKLIAEFRAGSHMLRTFELLRDNVTTAPQMKERRLVLLEWLEPNTPWKLTVPSLEVIVENARVQGSTAKHWSGPEVYEAVKNGLTEVREGAKKLLDLLPINEDDLQLAAEFSCRALRLARQTSAAYEAAKQAQGLLDFDDLLLQARDLLRDNLEVRQRVAAGIRLLMVDEFQDTDPVQAEVVRLLCGETLTRGRLFLVGDAKQSIYRFRRADPGVFSKLREEIPQPGRLPLTVNFRSQPAVLNFVNHLFAAAMGEAYEALSPFEPIQRSPTPTIEFLFATFDADGADAHSPLSGGRESPDSSMVTVTDSADAKNRGADAPRSEVDDSHTKVTAAELRSREADWIARRCAELLADPMPRIRKKVATGQITLRRVESGDIVILFRALSNVQEYEAALRHYGLDYYLVGGKAFFTQQEVFDLLNLCRYLDDPDDLIGLVGILRSPFFNLSDDAIQAISASLATLFLSGGREFPGSSHQSPQPSNSPKNRGTQVLRSELKSAEELVAFLPEEQQRRIGFAREVLVELRSIKDRTPLSKLLTCAVERTGYDAALLTEHLGSRKVANLRKLIEMAREFDQGELFTLKDFVERLQTSVLEETDEEFATTLPETGNVIRLMSIHQAKGLEFPLVVVADIDRKGPPRGRSAVLHPDFGALVKLPDMFGESHENLGLKIFGLLEKEADAEETIRLFYVACTRAADYLILSAGIEPDAKRNSPWLELVESRFDLRTGLPKTDALLGSSTAATAGRETIPDILAHKRPPVAKPVARDAERQVPLSELTDLILFAEPTEPPASARHWPRDTSDLPPLSVTRLEEIDAQLVGQVSYLPDSNRSMTQAGKKLASQDDEAVPVDPDQATALGTLVHAVLEQINFGQPANWPTLLEAIARTSKDQVSDDALSSARLMLANLLASPLAKELASAKSLHREVEFVLRVPASSSVLVPSPPSSGERVRVRGPNGDGTLPLESSSFSDSQPLTIPHQPPPESPPHPNPLPPKAGDEGTRIVGKIDLLYEDAHGGWHILDYKTNNIAADASDEKIVAPYELQLGVYAHAVEQWFGEPPCEVSLVMLRPLVRRVSFDLTPSRDSELQARIANAIDHCQRL
jgi:ATP-dependent helicase/nuclease subunit A